MFERYNVRARRALFFARYEASQIGGREIETEHLLLGVLRGGMGRATGLFARLQIALPALRQEVVSRSPVREPYSTSIEIPFSAETKAILLAAAEHGIDHELVRREVIELGPDWPPRSGQD